MTYATSVLRVEEWDEDAAERAELLAAERRWVALDELAGRTPPVDLDDLAAAVARRESERADGAHRVAVALHHSHLPKMSDLGVVEYDPERNRVLSCPDRTD